jgi:PAS domain S-box-containing protein
MLDSGSVDGAESLSQSHQVQPPKPHCVETDWKRVMNGTWQPPPEPECSDPGRSRFLLAHSYVATQVAVGVGGTLLWWFVFVLLRQWEPGDVHPHAWAVLLLGFTWTGLLLAHLRQRQRAAEALARTADSYRTLVDTMNVGLGVQDGHGRFVYVNNRVCEMCGYSRAEMLQLSVQDVVAEEDLEVFRAQMAARQKGDAAPYELTVRTKSGERIHTLVSPQLIRDSAGTVTGAFAIIQDITPRKHMEKALVRSEERYRTLVESLHDGLGTTDEDGNVTYANPRLCEMLGCPAEEMLGHPPDRFFDEEGRQRFQAGLAARRSGVAGYYELELIRVDGKKIPVVISARPLFDEAGAFRGVIAVMTDIAAQKRTEEALRQANLELDGMLAASPDMSLRLAADGTVLDYRAGAAADLFATSEEFLGKRGYELLPPPGDEQFRQAIARVGATGSLQTVEYAPEVGKGRTHEARLCPLTGGEILVLVRDVTARKQAEDQVHALSERLLTAQDDERQRIAHDLHDEFGQSLAGLSMAAQRLRAKLAPADHDLEPLAGQLCTGIDHAIQTMRSMQRGLHSTVLDDLGLEEAIDALGDEFQERTGIACVFDQASDPFELNRARQRALYRIVQESLTNVVRHSGASQVEISMHRDGTRLRIEIQDDGRGIDPEKTTAPTSYGLTGMRKRAELCGGSLEISAQPGEGTLIRVEIPIESTR